MDLPMKHKQTMTLRRHNTSPSSAGRSVIASVSVGRRITRPSALGGCRAAASMKSNPYVGWFRHSPPTAGRETWRTKQTSHNWCSVPSSLKACKNSPHIGWFRHSPPSRLDLSSTTSRVSPDLVQKEQQILLEEQEEFLLKLLQELNPALDKGQLRMDIQSLSQACQHVMVGGRLPGGGKDYLERTRSNNSHRERSRVVKDLRESSAEGTLSTVNALSRLASWFLFPLAHDAESCGYRPDQDLRPLKRKKKHRSREEGLLSQLSPYFPTFLEEPPRDIPQEEYEKYGGRAAADKTAHDEVRDDSDSSDNESVAPFSLANPPIPSNLNICSSDLNMSVSSLAEAYYAHQTTATKDMSPMTHTPLAPEPPSTLMDMSPISPHQLDYVITQMDIARMTRNASRHLDVHSILSLPVITYEKGAATTKNSASVASKQHQGWSWTIVEESEGQKECSEVETTNEKTDFCVICMEHFVNGDRLRVLPCDHSFHVGCIDRWLSGSQSFEECYTSGCPTCKKRPTVGSMGRPTRSQSLCEPTSNTRDGKHRSASLDGSVPSFAFAQLGSALFAQQEEEQGASICSGSSSS